MPNGEWDVFGWEIGLGMPIEWFDVDAIIALLDATSGVVIDQFVLGWDGEPANAFEVAQTLLRSKGFFVGTSREGKITFAILRMANVCDLGTSTVVNPIPFTLDWTPSEGEGVDSIRGTVGALPWRPGKPYEVNVLGDTELLNPPNSLRAGMFSARKSLELNLDVLTRPDDETLAQLISLATFRAFGAPVVRVRANNVGFDHGQMVELASPDLAEPWFVDVNGNLIDADGAAKWYGQVVGTGAGLPDSTIELDLVLHNWHLDDFPRLRAPAAVVSGRIANLYQVGSTFFSHADTPSDSLEFNIGDKVELWTPDGLRRSGTSGAPDVQEVTGRTVNSLTLDFAFTTSSVVGDVIRLAHLDDVNGYPEDGVATKCAGNLAYTYMADTTEEVAPTDLEGHIYGFGRI